MPDFAAAPIQPIAEGTITFPGGVGTVPVLDARGVSGVIRNGTPQGSYILSLDPGLPGNAGAVPAIAQPPNLPGVPDPDVRSLITVFGFGSPPISKIVTIGVSYIASPNPGVGAPLIEILLTNLGLVPLDPPGGFSFIIWRGQ